MHSSTIVLAVGLLAAPLALLTSYDNTTAARGLAQLVAGSDVSNTVNGRPLADAPVPGVAPAGVAAVDRVGGGGGRALDAGPVNSTPFSSTPTGTLSGEGSQAANADRVTTPASGPGATPNLGK